jgi:hypothetical protein
MAEPMLIALISHAPRSGKTSAARHLEEKHGFQVLSLAEPIKQMALVFLQEFGLDLATAHKHTYLDRESVIPGVGVTGRHILQTLGTEWGRLQLGSEIWLECWRRRALAHLESGQSVVVDDARFVNEVDAVLRLGGQAWLIHRPGSEQNAGSAVDHASEGNLKNYLRFTHVLVNDGTFDEFLDMVDKVLQQAGPVPSPGGGVAA